LQTTQSIPLDAFRFRRTEVLAADRLSSVGACNIPMHFHWAAAVRQRAEGPNRMSRIPKLLL